MRPARVTLSAAALRHNLTLLRQLAPQTRIWAVIKANAYGHGLAFAARALAGRADGFAVATLEEAEQLRGLGINSPILLLEGLYEPAEVTAARQLNLSLVVHTEQQIRWLAEADPHHPWQLWIKLDTGMHRLGFDWREAARVSERVHRLLPGAQCHVMSHLACSDEEEDSFTVVQTERFMKASQVFDGQRSLANSAALIRYPDTHLDWVRPGIALYGATPLLNELKPVMRFESALLSLRWLETGERVGYGLRWRAPRRSLIGVVAAGYGDGYPRHAPDGTPLWVDGARVPLVGRVSMDMLTVDLTDHPQRDALRPGAIVELWGEQVSVAEVAQYAGTIPYTLLCGITRRVHYHEEG